MLKMSNFDYNYLNNIKPFWMAHMTDNNTFLAFSTANLITKQQKQLIMFVKFQVCHSVRLLVS